MGCVFAGLNVVATDIVMATLMQYDHRKIVSLREGLTLPKWPLITEKASEIACAYDGKTYSLNELAKLKLCEPFVPARGWIGHIECD